MTRADVRTIDNNSPYSINSLFVFSAILVVLAPIVFGIGFYAISYNYAFVPVLFGGCFLLGLACVGREGLRKYIG